MFLSHVDTSMMTLHEKSLKKHLTWRTRILSFVTPFDLIFVPLEIYFSYLKLSSRHQSLKMPKNTLKMSFFCLYVTCLKANPRMIRDLLSIIPAYVRELLIYTTFYTNNPRVFLVYATIVSTTHVRLLKMSKKYVF